MFTHEVTKTSTEVIDSVHTQVPLIDNTEKVQLSRVLMTRRSCEFTFMMFVEEDSINISIEKGEYKSIDDDFAIKKADKN